MEEAFAGVDIRDFLDQNHKRADFTQMHREQDEVNE
jgi:hypothetical protein